MKTTDIITHDSPFQDKEVGGASRLDIPDFTHLGENGVPWFATVQVEYAPREKILDAGSVGEYMDGFRDMQLTPELIIKTVCSELAEASEPMMLNVSASYRTRSGVTTNVQARYAHPETKQQGPRIMAPGHA